MVCQLKLIVGRWSAAFSPGSGRLQSEDTDSFDVFKTGIDITLTPNSFQYGLFEIKGLSACTTLSYSRH